MIIIKTRVSFQKTLVTLLAILMIFGMSPILAAKKVSAGTDSSNLINVKGADSNSSVVVSSTAVDSNGNTYMTGYYNGNVKFDGVNTVVDPNSGAGSSIFIAKYSQDGSLSWVKTIGNVKSSSLTDSGRGIAVDSSGNVYVVGQYLGDPTNGQLDVNPDPVGTKLIQGEKTYSQTFLLKLNSSGDFQWVVSNRGPSSSNVYDAVAVNQTGTAVYWGGVNVPGTVAAPVITVTDGTDSSKSYNIAGNDPFVMKVDADTGAVSWFVSTSANSFNNTLFGLALDSDENVYAVGGVNGNPTFGSTTLANTGTFSSFVWKMDSSGVTQWADQFVSTTSVPNYAKDVIADSTGVYVTGYFQGTVDFDPGAEVSNATAVSYDLYIAKLNLSDGALNWKVAGGGSGADYSNNINVDFSGNVYVEGTINGLSTFGGKSLTPVGGTDAVVLKLSGSDGAVQWANNIGSSGSETAGGIGIYSNGNIKVGVSIGGDADVDPSSEGTLIATSSSGTKSGVALVTWNSDGQRPGEELEPPTLTADNTDNDTTHAIEITFTDDATWRGANPVVKDGSTTLQAADYSISEGKIRINAGVLTEGSHTIIVAATGYTDASVTQSVAAPTAGSGGDSSWTGVGSQGFSDGQAQYTSLALDNGTPYVAYEDFGNGNKATVMKFNGTSWEVVGNKGFSDGAAQFTSLAVDQGIPYVAYKDGGNTNKATVMKFTGTSWKAVGKKGFSDDAAQYTSLAVDSGTPYVAYQDNKSGSKATVMKFNGTSWEAVGKKGFSDGAAQYTSLAVDQGTPYVVYQDNVNGTKATVMKFTGTSWVAVGKKGFSDGAAYTPSITIDNGTPYVAYMDAGHSNKATVMKFNGTDWEAVGTPGFTDGVANFPALAVDNGTPYFAYRDGNNGNKATIMKFNGTSWEAVGTEGFSDGAANFTSLALDNGTPYVAYEDFGNGNKATVMKYESTLQDSTLDPASATFDRNTAAASAGHYQDVTTTIELNGNTLSDVMLNGTSIGAESYSYDSASHVLTLTKAYLATLGTGEKIFTFDMSAGTDPTFTVTISDSTPPALIADSTDNDTAHALEITFTEDATWRGVITAVKDGSTTLPATDYSISEGKISISLGVLTEGSHTITIVATGYADATVTQSVAASTAGSGGGLSWTEVGSKGFSEGQVQYTSLALDNGTPYVAYEDLGNGNKATVMKFNGTSWEVVGKKGFSDGGAGFTSLALDNGIPYVAYMDVGNSFKATVMKFTGKSWKVVGKKGFSDGPTQYTSLAFDKGTPYVAYQDNENGDKATVMEFNGTSWVAVGKRGFSDGAAQYTSLAFDKGTPYVAYQDNENGSKATVMKFTGTSWKAVGNKGFSDGVPYNLSFIIDNGTPYVAYQDAGHSYKATVMKFTGTSWEAVGTPGFSDGVVDYPSLAVDSGTPYLSYRDDNKGNKATIMKFNGASWEAVGTPGFSDDAANYTSLVVDQGTLYVAYEDLGNDYKATVMKYESTLQDSTLDPVSATFDRNTAATSAGHYQDVTTTIELNGNTLSDVMLNGTSIGAESYSYDSASHVLTLTKAYLATLGTGEKIFTFDMSAGTDPTFTVTISDSTPPALIADSSDNDTAHELNITFAEDATWRGAITAVKDGSTTLPATNYSISEGKIRISAGVLSMGSHTITVVATGYADATVTQSVMAPAVTSVSVSPQTASVVQGGTEQLTATVATVGGAVQTVTWTSSDASNKVTVDTNGLVSVAGDAVTGAYTITATSTADGTKSDAATITVTAAPPAPAVIGVSVSPKTASVVQGGAEQLIATVATVGGAAQTVTWTSSDASNKVTVDTNGLVSVAGDAAIGAYAITATSTADGTKSDAATITVTAAPPTPAVTSVTVNPKTASVVQGGTEQLTATVATVGGAAQTVTWTSGDASNKVTVDTNGLVSVAGDATVGAYTITATSTVDGTKSDAATITVTAAPPTPAVTSVSVSPQTASVVQGGTKQLTATVATVGGAAQTVTWTSSDASNKVTVDTNGLVSVAGDATVGAYTITATSTVDGTKKDTSTITVTAASTFSIEAIGDQTATPLIQGYAPGTQELKTISILNTGTGDLTNLNVSLSGTGAGAFDMTQPLVTTLNSGAPATSFTVKAQDGLPAGTYAATVTVTADHLANVSFDIVQVVNLPNAPANPQHLAAIGGDRQVTLTWSTVTEATYYNLYMSTTSGQFGNAPTATVTEATYRLGNLTNGTAYYFVVKAGNPGGWSAASNEASATPATVPAAPANVTATAGDGLAVIAFTAPSDNGGSPITGYEVTASPGNIIANGTAGPITVTGLSNETTYTFTVRAINRVGKGAASTSSNPATPSEPSSDDDSGNDNGSGNTGGGGGGGVSDTPAAPSDANPSSPPASNPVDTPSTPDTGVEVLVNGKVENAGTANTVTVNDQTVTTITVDPQKLEDRLAAEGDHTVITIPVNLTSDVVVGELNGQMVNNMEQKQAVIEIKTDNATYTLPAQQINIGALSDQLGQNVNLQDIKVQIEISKPSEDMVKVVENSAVQGEFTIVAPPLDFTVSGSYGDTTIDVSNFNAYVERTIAIPDGVDPSKITTGVVIDPDGTVRHVPTKVEETDGRYYAKINSLTNSTYSVVWHPIEFADVAHHWAKEAVNDMGSRMVIDGTGNGLFNPDQEITRAEFAAVMVRGLGLKLENGATSFSDVEATDWYSSIIKTANSYHLIDGFEDGTFRPNDKITREQAMVIIAKAAKITGLMADLPSQASAEWLSSYADAGDASEWAVASIADCLQAGIVSGRDGTQLAPQQSITRAEVAVIVQRLLQKSGLIQ